MYRLAELALGVHRDASPGIEFTGAVNNVSAEALKGHPKVKRVAVCQKKRGLLGASLPAGRERWFPGCSGGVLGGEGEREGAHAREQWIQKC